MPTTKKKVRFNGLIGQEKAKRKTRIMTRKARNHAMRSSSGRVDTGLGNCSGDH